MAGKRPGTCCESASTTGQDPAEARLIGGTLKTGGPNSVSQKLSPRYTDALQQAPIPHPGCQNSCSESQARQRPGGTKALSEEVGTGSGKRLCNPKTKGNGLPGDLKQCRQPCGCRAGHSWSVLTWMGAIFPGDQGCPCVHPLSLHDPCS